MRSRWRPIYSSRPIRPNVDINARVVAVLALAVVGAGAVGFASARDASAPVVYLVGALVAIGGALAVPTIEKRAATRRAYRHSKRLRGIITSLDDLQLARTAMAQFLGEIYPDDSILSPVKLLLLQHIRDASSQLNDPLQASEGRERLRGFLLASTRLASGLHVRSSATTSVPREAAIRPTGLVNAGVEAEERGDFDQAEDAYVEAMEHDDVVAAVRLGMLLERLDRLSKAEVAYRRADELGSAAGAARLGFLLEKRGEFSVAESAYRRAHERGSPSGSAHLADILQRRGDGPAASAAAERANDLREALTSGAR